MKISCPKRGGERLVLGIIDSGSRYTIINSEIINECFTEDDLKLRYVDKEYERYSFDFTFPQLENYKMNISSPSILFNSFPEEVRPDIILCREDFLKQFIVCTN
ncbi:hypothetical protein [Acidianus sp. HS-5]|uniref:hypothetical protein n=1 Tax=Acidianus sp. HS-5 TaxID=2886040 RepID=UPI001F31487F|nr:hypothetical protein [Acidianus sp. HS-5]BDC17768.1 hypothetical protein HS5_06580 [Acidianus sp. HS-5]